MIVAAGFLLLPVVTAANFEIGWELTFSFFYMLPIALVSWKGGRGAGVVASFLSAGAWLWADVLTGLHYSNPSYLWWNAAIRLGFFLVVTLTLVEFRKTLERARSLARTDPLTGAANSRFFGLKLGYERERCLRYGHPLSVAYLDIDDFKSVNDRYGHSVGDRVLTALVRAANAHLRDIDVVGRLGGDEFAVLLPETDVDGARHAMDRVREAIAAEMDLHGWPVTMSAGMVTFVSMPSTPDDIVRMADDLMYRVKTGGKNAILHEVRAA